MSQSAINKINKSSISVYFILDVYIEIHTCKTNISSLIEMSGDEGIYLRLLFQCAFTDTCILTVYMSLIINMNTYIHCISMWKLGTHPEWS